MSIRKDMRYAHVLIFLYMLFYFFNIVPVHPYTKDLYTLWKHFVKLIYFYNTLNIMSYRLNMTSNTMHTWSGIVESWKTFQGLQVQIFADKISFSVTGLVIFLNRILTTDIWKATRSERSKRNMV